MGGAGVVLEVNVQRSRGPPILGAGPNISSSVRRARR
jgi:hypothetical protein